MFTLPNVLSLTRLPIGAAVALTAIHDAWGLAFALVLLGCLTDLADGYVAKRWNMGSKLGAEVLEPICDLALTVGAIVGLVMSHHLSIWLILVMGILAGIVQYINSFMTKTVLFTHFGQWFMPMYFLVVIWLLLIGYAHLALNSNAFIAFVGLASLATIFLIGEKRERFRAWFTPAQSA